MYWEPFDEILPFTGLNLILTQDDGTTFCFGPGDDVPFCKDPTTAAPTTTTTTTTTTAGAACVCRYSIFPAHHLVHLYTTARTRNMSTIK